MIRQLAARWPKATQIMISAGIAASSDATVQIITGTASIIFIEVTIWTIFHVLSEPSKSSRSAHYEKSSITCLFRANFWPLKDISILFYLRLFRWSVKLGLAAHAQPLRSTASSSCVCGSTRVLSLFTHRYRVARRVRESPSIGRKALDRESWIASHVWVDQ